MFARVPRRERIHRKRIAIERRLPLAGLRAHETVEIFEAESRRPAVKRPSSIDLPHWGVVPFPECGGAIAVLLEHFGHGRGFFRPYRVVARITRRKLGDVAEAHLVTVTPGK